jgi:hypothetical protein
MSRDITVYFADGSSHIYKNAPDDATPDQTINFAKRDFPNKQVQHLDGGEKQRLTGVINKEETWGQAGKNVAGQLTTGVGQLAQLPGQLYGLATGNFGGTEFGKDIEKYGKELTSEQYKARGALRDIKVKEAEEKGGQLSAAGTAIKETFKDPRLLAGFLVETVPQLIPALLTGGGTAALTSAGIASKEATKLVASGMAKEAAEIAAKQAAAPIAGRLGAAAAKGTGALQQGASVGAETYESTYKKLKQNGASDEEAASRAIGLARAAGASGAVISVLAQNLPGAGAIENFAAGVPGKFTGRLSNLAAGAAGEGVGEAIEEGAGKFTQNLAQRDVDPNQKLFAGVGEAAGMGAVGGIGLGGAAGALRKPGEKAETVQGSEAPPAGTQQPAAPETKTPEQKTQERAEYVEGLANALLETGISKQEALQIAEEKVAEEEAADAQYKTEQESKQQEVQNDVQQPNAESTGAGVPMVSEPDTGAPATGLGTSDTAGVVPTTTPTGESDAGAAQQRDSLTDQQPAETNDQPITSFTTSQGSTYQVDSEGRTSRTKNSEGKGQGETYAPHPALYVSPEAQQKILDDKNGDNKNRAIRLGYHADGMFHPVTNLTEIPQGAVPSVVVQDRTSNEIVGIYGASAKPQVGLHPVEKLYTEDGNSSTHVGNQITKVQQGNVETPQAELTAEDQQGLQQELTEEQNQPEVKAPISGLTAEQRRVVQEELDAEYDEAVVKKSIAASIGKPDLAFHGFTNAVQAIQHVAKVGNAFQSLLAKRLASALKGVEFIVVEGENVPPELGIPAAEWNGANGAFVRDKNGKAYILVRGAERYNAMYQGVNNITVLHEALHAALQQKIDAGLKRVDAGLVRAVKALEKTMQLARERAQTQLDENKLPDFLHDLLLDGKVFDDVHEFVSYAMTDPKFQKWLMDTPGQIVKTLYNQFVNNVRQFFNMSENSVNALSDIINITDQLLAEKTTKQTKAQTETGTVLKQVKGKLTEAFKKWFGNSKVVDENGDPLVVYHGTTADIETFKLSKEGALGAGIYLTPNPNFAGTYADTSNLSRSDAALDEANGQNVMPLYASIKNPLVLSAKGDPMIDALVQLGVARNKAGAIVEKAYEEKGYVGKQVMTRAITQGFDGIMQYRDGELTEVVAFSPTQIKSATGNNGEYSPFNPNIKFSKAPRDTKAAAAEAKLGKGNFADDLQEISTLTKLRSQSEFVDAAMDIFESLNIQKLRQLLPSLQTSAVVEWAGRLGMSHIVDADKHMRDMAGEKNKRMNQMLPKFDKLINLRRKSLAQYKQLANVMHYTTLLSRDPTNAKVLAKDAVLKRLWNGLDADTKKIYEEIRDFYIEQHTAYYDVLTKQIEASGLQEPEKSKIIAALKQVYETGRTMYPYFPLMRYGQHWIRVGKGVSREFYMFESEKARNKFMKERAKQLGKSWKLAVEDGDIDVGNDLTDARKKDLNSTEALKTLFKSIDAGAIEVTDDFGNVVSSQSSVNAEALKDQIYQMYLQTLPDKNFRKQFIMRKGIAGFSGDIARNFVTSGVNMANQLSRIEYGGKAMKELELAKAALQNDPDKLKKGEFLAEMTERVTMQVRPDADDTVLHKAANLANTASYLWLMTSVKTAVAQLSAVPVFVGPVLTANHGFNPAKVATALGKSLAIFGSNGIVKKNSDGTESYEFPSMLNSGLMELTGDEKLAAEYMIERGITENTMTYDLVGKRNAPTAEAESKTNRVGKAVVGVMTGLFHHTERMVREITFMTSYRLYREDLGKAPNAHEKALELAEKETNEALGAYSAYERPRGVLQSAQRKVVLNAHSPLGKTLLQFKMFAMFATTFFVRNAYRMFAGLDAKERAQAMTKLLGSVFMSLSLAGYVGVPGISMAIGAVQGMMDGLKELFGDEDDEEELLEDRDWEFWFRNKWLPETFGDTVGGVLNRGLIAELSGYDITSSLSFQNMWFPEVKEQATAQATVDDYLLSLLGPSASLARTVPKAIDFFNKGEIVRGMETLMPAFVKGAFTAERYAREGATTTSGLPIKEADEFTAGQLLMQSLGFASTDLVNQRELIYKAQGQILEVQRERTMLLDKLNKAELSGDDKELDKTMDAIDKYNVKNSFLEIDDDTITQSLNRRAKARAEAQRGMPYNKRFEGQFDESLERSLKKFEK